MNEIELPFATITFKEPVLYLRFNREIRVEVKDMLDILNASDKLGGYKPYLTLTYARFLVDVVPEAQKIGASKERNPNVLASAIVVKWLAQRLISNVFVKINKPHYPVRVFNDEKKALEWLLKQKTKKEPGVPLKSRELAI